MITNISHRRASNIEKVTMVNIKNIGASMFMLEAIEYIRHFLSSP